MKKDIYIIRNTINDKVYIGQAKNAAERWLKHLSAARKKYNYVIARAMNKYGIENFYYQILESQISDYDEREKYWIKKYNSRVPNGYNVAIGGNGTGIGINNPRALFDSLEDVLAIIDKLQNTNVSMTKISEQIGCAESVISQINLGITYKIDDIDYPIRKTRYDIEKIKQIQYSLGYELDKSMAQIAKEYTIDLSQLNEMNQGKLHPLPGKKYPLRAGRPFSLNKDFARSIVDELQNTSTSMQDIAKKYNVSKSFISAINKGLLYHDDDIKYPIRDNYQSHPDKRVCFSPSEIVDIENALKGRMSIRDIAKEYGVSYQSIMNINNGVIVKYHKDSILYPIRKIHKK